MNSLFKDPDFTQRQGFWQGVPYRVIPSVSFPTPDQVEGKLWSGIQDSSRGDGETQGFLTNNEQPSSHRLTANGPAADMV